MTPVSAKLRRLVVRRAQGLCEAGDRLTLRRALIKAGRYPSVEALARLRD